MRFKAKKVYGQYKRIPCPFCERTATQKNEQGLDVCHKHTNQNLDEIKCTCGSWLELRNGKFGPYFNCINCGNFNYTKAMEIKAITHKEVAKDVIVDKPKPVEQITETKKEITISSNDVEYFD
ncbi:hypothetical protein HOL21_03125 [Candidatus Woesearchaeota archaeon]|nr:hypothetical protein [Candidatus Woesearchaeota archaeon]MBT5397179.1 hypothetical protein [Candidatus Woesearchaeota archaeon]MBT5924832.1 hypothetical protein [Candidatus Woesearchaeota archaeon]MBT6367275.1 hypothetical protein [Candidatus Woesearchaeota archaeon]MBT7762579.1 hypothetical protein [Candidatus Woesearchaeota archaeon]